MPNQKKSEYIISVNAREAVTTTKALEERLKSLRATYNQLVQAGKEGSERAKQIHRDMKDLESVIKQNKVQYELIDNVVGNLSGSTLSQLQRALRNVKKSMNLVSEDGGKLKELQQKYRAIQDQIKIMQGEYVNIRKHISELSTMTDSWLSRAIQQQKSHIGTIHQENNAYKEQKDLLTQLEAEQTRRAVLAAGESYKTAVATVNSGKAGYYDLSQAKKAITSYRDLLPSDSTQIQMINDLLVNIDAQMDKILGKERQVKQTTEEIVWEAQQIAIDPQKFSPDKIKMQLDKVNTTLKKIPANDPFRKQLNDSARKLEQELERIEHEGVDVDDVLRRMKTRSVSFDELDRAAKRLEAEIKHLKLDQQEYIEKSKQLEQVRSQIESTTLSVKKHSFAWQTTIRNISTYFGVFQLFSLVQQKLTAFFRLNLKFSDQLADIRKVSGLAIQDVNRLSTSLAKLDTRTSIQELHTIAYEGAKLGIDKYGVEGLESFVRAANQVNVALKEELGQEALTALAKIIDTMNLIPKMGVEKSMLSVGSALFQLSAFSTAASNNIVEFTKRLTGVARSAGITTDQLLALGSASDSMFLMPEVASTAFNRLFTSLQTKHNLIEKELQIEPGTINNLYQAGRTIDAIVLIFEKMREKGNMNALQGVFKDFGSEGARLVNVMVTMSKNVDMLKDHLYTSEIAFEEATAVSQEYAIQQETANALMERASNIWEKAFVNPEGVDQVKAMARWWYELSQTFTHSVFFMGEAKASLWMIAQAFKVLLFLLPTITQMLLFKGVGVVFFNMRKWIAALITAYKLWKAEITATMAAQQGLNAAMKSNLLGLIGGLIASAVVWLVQYGDAAEDAADKQKDLNRYMDDAAAKIDNEKRKLDSYLAVLNDTNTSTEERKRIFKKFNHEYQPYLTKLGLEVTCVEQLEGAYEKLNDEIKKKMYYQMKERAYDDMLGEASGGVSSAVMDYSRYVNQEGSEWSGFDSKWLQSQVDAGRNADEIYKNMVESVYGSGGVWSGYDGSYLYGQGHIGGGSVSVNDKVLKSYISKFVNANQTYNKTKTEIDQAFDPMIGDYNPFKDEPTGSLDNDAPDKDALKKAREEAARQKQEWRKELKDAQDQAKAIIDNIKNFYQRQINEVLRTANEQNWDTTLTDAAVRAVEGRKNLALSQARKSIAGVQNSWEEFKTTMNQDLREQADETGFNESSLLLNSIQSSDPQAIRDLILDLSQNLELPENSAIDAIWRNASQNEGNIETAEQKRRKEVLKRLLDDNYTGKVDNEYTQSMETLGFFDLTPEQTSSLLAGGADAEALLGRRAKEISKVLKNARETNLYAIDDRYGLMEALFGPNWQTEPTELSNVFQLTGDDLQVFYRELIKYSDSYTEALKRSRERQKKILNEQWMKTDQFHANEDAQKQSEFLAFGVGQFSADVQERKAAGERIPRKDTYGTASFISSMGQDPEINSYRLKMEAAQAYYDFLKAHQADADTLRDAEQAILKSEMDYAHSVAEQMKQRINDIYELASPAEDFGSSIGEAFATMTEDADAGRKAMEKAIGDMINAFMKQTVEMTKEYMKRRIMQKMNDKLISTTIKQSGKKQTDLEKKKQEDITNVHEQGGEARKFLNEEVEGDIQQTMQEIGNEALQVQQQQTTQEVQTESAKTQANTAMGIASGASKIIGSLGWWGIPLVAVITALLNGLLSFAMSKVSSLFGGGKDSSDDGLNVKLATGMLTYDEGNVQAFSGVQDGKTYPVVGSDGKVYAAKDGGELSTGLVKDPITTLVNGQPALVAERGPEMVIGRETTAAMMMARPDLLREIVKFDRSRASGQTYRAYDSGNIGDLPASVLGGSPTETPASLSPADIAALRASLDGFSAVLTLLQRNGLHVNKYGRGGITQAAADGANFMRRNSGDRLWKG